MAKIKRTLVLTVDLTGGPDWQITAHQNQLAAWLEKNRAILPFEGLIILPVSGETKLYWLEGNPEDVGDVKTLDEIKNRIKPVMEVALDIKIDKKGLFKDPFKKSKVLPFKR
jgi:hypothetical protein